MTILILGGSGSGKSEFAENCLIEKNKSGVCYYMATMMSGDDAESANRIKRHREMRKGKGFVTVEQPYDIEKCLDRTERDGSILLEDLSNLLANEMFANKKNDNGNDCIRRILKGIKTIAEKSENLVIVSNNIFEDGIEYDEETQRYIRSLGFLNAEIASFSDEVWEVVCGIPVPVRLQNSQTAGEVKLQV